MAQESVFTLLLLIAIPLLAVTCILLRSSISIAWRARTRKLTLPPGPSPLPIIGNLLDFPITKAPLAFKDMCSRYGDIVYLQSLGRQILVLGNGKLIMELLSKGTPNTSDRRQTVMFHLTGTDINFASLPYGPRWRKHRRAFWQHFHPNAIAAYQPVQRAATHNFLLRLLDSPSDLKQHIRYTFASALVEILYGVTDPVRQAKIVDLVEAVLHDVGEHLVPGKYLVEYFPFLRHVPPWVPGARVQKESIKWRATVKNLKEIPLQYMQEALARNESTSCIVSKLLEKTVNLASQFSRDEEEDIVKNVAVVTFEAGSDTVFSTLQSAFLAMSLYPDVQRKAQAELHKVVGPHRLPDFGDRDALVYVQALIKEALRWQNVAPFGVPHRTMEDDIFHGYFIPGGTVIMPNIWACMHDPEIYERPDEFRPERYIRDGKLDPGVQDPAAFVFGFGRRICPGRYFAENALFINLASVLHVFDIGPPLDESGDAVEVKVEMTDGILAYPKDCRCTIKPRSVDSEVLVRRTLFS